MNMLGEKLVPDAPVEDHNVNPEVVSIPNASLPKLKASQRFMSLETFNNLARVYGDLNSALHSSGDVSIPLGPAMRVYVRIEGATWDKKKLHLVARTLKAMGDSFADSDRVTVTDEIIGQPKTE